MKSFLITILLLIGETTWSQKDSINFNMYLSQYFIDGSMRFNINFSIQSIYKRPIYVTDSISEFDLQCPEFSPLSFDVEILDSNCYKSRNPDCDIFSLDYFTTQREKITLNEYDSLKYKFDIDKYFFRQVNNSIEMKVINYIGHYRIRIKMDYYLDKELKTAYSRWFYKEF